MAAQENGYLADYAPVRRGTVEMRHTKPRFRLKERLTANKRRRKGVEFMAGLHSNSFFFFKKRNPMDSKR
ncbi:MAG: hypothetical protein HY913_06100 [Desulfomonile tiedjei]|nr:hypothetical protein [Desulfomonile tiedjei]